MRRARAVGLVAAGIAIGLLYAAKAAGDADQPHHQAAPPAATVDHLPPPVLPVAIAPAHWPGDRPTISRTRPAARPRASAALLPAAAPPASAPAPPAAPTTPSTTSGIPSWWLADIMCVFRWESGSDWTTWAGGLGFTSKPDAYGSETAGLIDIYGDTWANWPPSAQITVAWRIYTYEHGWSPGWALQTQERCGL